MTEFTVHIEDNPCVNDLIAGPDIVQTLKIGVSHTVDLTGFSNGDCGFELLPKIDETSETYADCFSAG